jgi:hypothetical protein
MVLHEGSVISVPVHVLGYTVDHEGIFFRGERGEAKVISNSKKHGCVKEESWAEFQSGAVGPVTVQYLAAPYQSRSIVARARSRIGQKWELLSNNCEHFTRWARNLDIESPQLRKAIEIIKGAIIIALAIWLARKYLK